MSDLWKSLGRSGNSETRAILANGGDPNEIFDGLPVLHHAILEDAGVDCLRLLLESGADPNLAERGRGWTALFFAAQSNAYEAMRLLLESGADCSIADARGSTPLHIAVGYATGDLTGVLTLLEAGADPDFENLYGISPRAGAERIANFNTRDAFVGF